MKDEQSANGPSKGCIKTTPLPYLTPEDRIKELEKLLAANAAQLQDWKDKHPISTVIYELKAELLALKAQEPHLSPDLTFANWASVLFVAIIIGGFYCFLRDHDPLLVYDYLGYVFPLLAGWTAGFGLYTKRAVVPAFLFSLLLLVLGFGSYVHSKQLFDETAWAVVVVAATSTALYWLIVRRAQPTETDNELWPIRWVAAGISLLLLIVFFGLWGKHNLNWPIFNAR